MGFKFNENSSDILNHGNRIKQIEDQISEIQKNALDFNETLMTKFGIFASIISFLTIEFQFLKVFYSFEKILGFSFILFSLLFSFNMGLHHLVKSNSKEKSKPVGLIIFNILIFLLGVFWIYRGNEDKHKEQKIYEKYSEEFNYMTTEFTKKYDQRLIFNDEKVKHLQKDYDQIFKDLNFIKHSLKKLKET